MVTAGVIYIEPCFLIPVFFVPATLFFGVLLIDDCNRHQFAWRWQDRDYKSQSHAQQREAEKTIDGQIRGFGGDESPLNTGEEKRASHREPFIHSSLKNTELLAMAFLVGLTGNKWSLSGRRAILVPSKTRTH